MNDTKKGRVRPCRQEADHPMTTSRGRFRASSLVVTAAVFALVVAACGSSGSKSNGASATTNASSSQKLAAATLNGSGSTFQQAYDQVAIAKFKEQQPNVTINYAGGGSGKGQTDLQGQLVDFAGSDSLPKPTDLPGYKGGALLYFPTVVAPITLSYNLSGVSKLKLSADTIAKIFQGQIKRWNDAAIKADNPGTSLPSSAITVVHRSDSSGTTGNFTKYLTLAAPATWKLGSDKTVSWPTGTQAGNGNGGVAQIVKSTNGAIGYVDYSDAKASGLTFASIKNRAGKYVAPTLDGASAAAAGATVAADLSYNPLDAPGDSAYPITSPTYVLVYKTQTDHAKGAALKAFLTYVLGDGQDVASSVDFAKLPDTLRQKAAAQVDQIVVPQ
ncbi:MAG TPA: phosphate ABC transporter substrate-binding protein PstS [Acidimicrobiales bacterium]